MLEKVAGVVYGADYNPEQWDRATWAEDLQLMRQAGVNLVNVGIFSWAELEPCLGEYRFDWLDEVLDGLAAAGIHVNLANATATPPPWFSTCYPEALPVLADGSRLWPGARQAFCPSSPVYREHALGITRLIAERYADHPALVMWHVSNEIGGRNAHCYCDVSAAAFREWLEARYKTLNELNRVWGTTFWGQRYSDWHQILPPRQAPTFRNPAHDLDFRRFSSDACLEIFRAERDVIRAVTPDIPVTTNIIPNHRDLDYWRWAPEVDVVAVDHYLKAHDPDAHIELALTADIARGLAAGEPWMLMEHSTGAVNWQPRNTAKQPGEMIRNSLQHVARGADSVMFFQWRASRFGAEKYHSAMVPHAGTDSRIWNEVVELGGILQRLGGVVGAKLDAEVALLFDYESQWALETSSHPSIDVAYLDRVAALYRAMWEAGLTVDIVPPDGELTSYKMVLVPSLYITSKATAADLEQFVAAGGHAIVTYMSGIVDGNLHIPAGPHPGAIRDWLGVWVEEFFPLRAEERVTLDDDSQVATWTEMVRLNGAEVVTTYKDGPLPGVPAVTRHAYGEGTVWYLATRLDHDAIGRLVGRALKEAGVKPPIPVVTAPTGLEVTRRRTDSGSFLFLINHSKETAHVLTKGHDLVQDVAVTGTLSLLPGRVAVIAEEER
jgi:beta-galactosidase